MWMNRLTFLTMQKSGNDIRQKATVEDRKKWLDAWAAMMVDIWKEKIERLQVYETWRLHESINYEQIRFGSDVFDSVSITHTFCEYGIYVDAGVGKEFKKGNEGDLGFTPIRQPKAWFSKKYFSSIMVLKEHISYMYGEEFCAIMADAISDKDDRKIGRFV